MPKCPFCRLHTDTGDELQDHLTVKHPEEITDTSGIRRTQARKFKRSKKQPIVVDGNNIAYSDDGGPEVNNIKKARATIIKAGYKPIIFVSAALRHDIDNPTELHRLVNLGWLIEVEGGQDDDVMIIEEAQRKNCKIISNDNFSEYVKDYSGNDWNLRKSIKNFSFTKGKFTLKQ